MAEDLSRIVPRPASGKPQPADPNAGTWRDPRQYDPEFLSQVGGEAIVDVYEGLAQMPEQVYKVFRGFMERQRQKSPEGLRGTADPYDTAAYDAAVLALEGAAKEPVKTAKSAAKALAEYGKEAVSSPAGMTKFLAENLTPGPSFRRAPVMSEIQAYQGSPAKFAPTPDNPLGEFDVSKMSSGVGQQNRGPGTYIAENPKVAQRYRMKYSPVMKTGEKRHPGYMYTVDLPDPMIEKMIDLDAPIVNQSKIRDTLLKIADDGVLPTESAEYLRLLLTTSDRRFQKTPLTGYGLVAVPREFGGIFKDVAEANTVLQRYGIPGSKWLDDVSRGPDKGTRNFVVFPGEEKRVKILSREGPEGQKAFSGFPRVDQIERFPLGPTSIKPRVIAQGKPLFRETSSSGLNDFLRDDRTFGYNNVFVTDDPTLALGQGSNKGVLVQFRPNAVSGELSRKPGTGVIGGQEYQADVFAPKAVERVTFKNPKQDLKGLAFGTRQNLMQNFDRIQNEDGSVTFVRKTED
jgi:hypothetical protein